MRGEEDHIDEDEYVLHLLLLGENFTRDAILLVLVEPLDQPLHLYVKFFAPTAEKAQKFLNRRQLVDCELFGGVPGLTFVDWASLEKLVHESDAFL